MQVFDRLKSITIDSSKLPNYIDLGRYFVVESGQDLTNRVVNVGVDKFISQELLESKNKSLQDLFCYFNAALIEIGDNDFAIIPLIQSVKDKLSLNKFEELLESKVFHLEEIFRQPHYLLQRTIEKVNVSRAKRIPAKSYQNLASHTEDWLHKSIVDFKPRRILNEELDLQYDVYENQVTIALIERCLIYLNSRIHEVRDISNFLDDYYKLLEDRNDSTGWYKKIDRNLSLIGCVYEDDNYNGNSYRIGILSDTRQRLLSLSKRLKALQSTPLFNEVNQRSVQSLMSSGDVRPTNVISNHRHYRYVRDLWLALNKIDHEKSEKERIQHEQDVINGVRGYSKSIIAYIIKNILGYEIEGSYSNWMASHPYLSNISLKETKDKCLALQIGDSKFSFVVFCNPTPIDAKVLPPNLFVLSLSEAKESDRIIGISPYDADSIERVGKVIKSYIVKDFLSQISVNYEYPHVLRDFVDCIISDDIVFHKNFTYSYNGIPMEPLKAQHVIELLEQKELFKQRSRLDKDSIRKEMESLVNTINYHADDIASRIVCLDCMSLIQRRNLRQLSYIQCDCGFVLDSTSSCVIFSNKDGKYSKLRKDDWGMDYVTYSK